MTLIWGFDVSLRNKPHLHFNILQPASLCTEEWKVLPTNSTDQSAASTFGWMGTWDVAEIRNPSCKSCFLSSAPCRKIYRPLWNAQELQAWCARWPMPIWSGLWCQTVAWIAIKQTIDVRLWCQKCVSQTKWIAIKQVHLPPNNRCQTLMLKARFSNKLDCIKQLDCHQTMNVRLWCQNCVSHTNWIAIKQVGLPSNSCPLWCPKCISQTNWIAIWGSGGLGCYWGLREMLKKVQPAALDLVEFHLNLIWFSLNLMLWLSFIHSSKHATVPIAGETLRSNWPCTSPLEDDSGECQTRKAVPLSMFCDVWSVIHILGICSTKIGCTLWC